MARMGFAIDNRACIGCHACTVACKSEHDVPLGVNRTWVKYIEKGTFPNAGRSFSVQRCNHCDDAPCVEICPVTSLFQRPDGIVDFDNTRCIGCKACMQACPYDALYLDPETLTAAKCNYCTHRVDRGLEPACVVICPVDAIVSGDLDDPDSAIAKLDRTQQVQYPKVEKNTSPKLFYVGGETAALDPAQAPPREDYLWSEGGPRVTLDLLSGAKHEAEQAARARRVYDTQAKPAPWDWKVSAYVTAKAAAAGTMFVSFIEFAAGQGMGVLPPVYAVISLLLLGLTGLFLVADLKQPRRFLYVLLRPQWKSWLVRGAYLITAFGAMLVVCAGLSVLDASRTLQVGAGALASLLALCTAAYTALLFAQAKGRDYWQNPVHVLTMSADAVIAGMAIATLVGALPIRGGMIGIEAEAWLALGAMLLGGLLVLEHLLPASTRNAQQAGHILLRGSYCRLFWIGAVGVGLVLPIGLALMHVAVPAAVLLIVGIVIKNHLLVQAPQRVALA